VRLFAPVEVTDIEMGKRAMVASMRDGPTIRCRALVLATGYEFPKLVPLRGHRITSTWAIATKPQRARLWPEECLIWEAADPYLYIRTTPDARVICGGEDAPFLHAAERDALISRKVARIRHKLGTLFPRLDTTPEFAWTASFGVTSTAAEYRPDSRPQELLGSLGYGGNGITYSRIAAELVRSGLSGGTDPDADLFAFR